MKGLILVIAAAFALGVAVLTIGSASAQEADLSGRGALYARGSGLAVVEGDGRVNVRSFGYGQVIVCGAEQIEAHGEGRRIPLPGDCVQFIGWKGTVHAAGDDLKVTMESRRISYTAEGQGHAFLKGIGSFKVGDLYGRWTKDGVRVHYSS